MELEFHSEVILFFSLCVVVVDICCQPPVLVLSEGAASKMSSRDSRGFLCENESPPS